MMENIIDSITSSNLYLAIAILLGIFITYAIIKKLIKMLLISVIIIVLYVAYLSYTGEKIPRTREEVVNHLSEKFREGGKKGKEILEKNLDEMKLRDLRNSSRTPSHQ